LAHNTSKLFRSNSFVFHNIWMFVVMPIFWITHYRKLSNCRERKTLPWVSSWAHGKRAICRVQKNKHSAKYEHTAKKVFAVCHKGKHTANSCTKQNKNFTKCFFCLPCVWALAHGKVFLKKKWFHTPNFFRHTHIVYGTLY